MNKKHNTKKLRVALASYDARQIRVWKHYLEEQGIELSCRGYRCGEELLLALREEIGSMWWCWEVNWKTWMPECFWNVPESWLINLSSS